MPRVSSRPGQLHLITQGQVIADSNLRMPFPGSLSEDYDTCTRKYEFSIGTDVPRASVRASYGMAMKWVCSA